MILPEISNEQQSIIDYIKLNYNVVVDSVAGSGKTTSNLHISKYFTEFNILLLTYNSRLKDETRNKVQQLEINNLEVHSYHSFCYKYYDNKCINDTFINSIIKRDTTSVKQFNYDLIVLDECQDMNSLYYKLVCKIFKDNNNKKTKLCIFGDKNQSIFTFNKADQRFIELADKLFNFNEYEWKFCKLSTSFRVTSEMSIFINNCLLKENRLISNKKTNNKPRYINCNVYDDDDPLNEIKYYLSLGYKPCDIFILAPSIKSPNTPIRTLENRVKESLTEVMVFVPTNDEEKIDEQLTRNKMIFSTFHQTKGLERKVVIIFNFDSSYFQYYKKDVNQELCPNEIYVATTRGIDHLTLFHHQKKKILPFISYKNIVECCNIIKPNKENLFRSYELFGEEYEVKNISTTDIVKYIPQDIIDDCYDLLEITNNERFTLDKISIKNRVSNIKTIESVSEITGIAIPLMFETIIKKSMGILDILKDVYKNNNLIQNIDVTNITVHDLLYISNHWNSIKSGYIHKLTQITDYNWLNDEELKKCVDRLLSLDIDSSSIFEYKCCVKNETILLNTEINGYIDCVDIKNDFVYEFKCVNKLDKTHFLQLAIYMYIYETIKLIEQIESLKSDIREYEKGDNYISTHILNVGDTIKFNENDTLKIGVITKIFKTTKKINIISDNITKKISRLDVKFVKQTKSKELDDKLFNLQYLYESLDICDKINALQYLNTKTKYVLFNVLTNEYFTIKCDYIKLKNLVKTLIYHKKKQNTFISDEVFIEQVLTNKLIDISDY